MPDVPAYATAGLMLGATNEPIVPDTLRLNGDITTDQLRTGNELQTSLIVATKHMPSIGCELYNIGALAAMDKFAAAETITLVQAAWRARAEDADLGSGYLSAKFASGVVFPVSVKGGPERAATLEIKALGHFSGGNAWTLGTDAVAAPAVTSAYYPKHIIVGADTIVHLLDAQVNFEHEIEGLPEFRPTLYYAKTIAKQGSARIRDLSKAITAARLEAGVKETTLTLVFEDRGPAAGADVSFALGNCYVTSEVQGDEATLSFQSVT
jgi:hypothetical protein